MWFSLAPICKHACLTSSKAFFLWLRLPDWQISITHTTSMCGRVMMPPVLPACTVCTDKSECEPTLSVTLRHSVMHQTYWWHKPFYYKYESMFIPASASTSWRIGGGMLLLQESASTDTRLKIKLHNKRINCVIITSGLLLIIAITLLLHW